MTEIEILKKEIEKIKKRNKKVESDKAWETSIERKLTISFLTYIVILLFFIVTQSPRPILSAIVPSAGFLLSTLTVDVIKTWWLKNRK